MTVFRLCCLRLRHALNFRLIRMSVIAAYLIFLLVFIVAVINRVDVAGRAETPFNAMPREDGKGEPARPR